MIWPMTAGTAPVIIHLELKQINLKEWELSKMVSLPQQCEVNGKVRPVDTNTYPFHFRVLGRKPEYDE